MEKISRILLIEDDPMTAYLHKKLIEGYDVAHKTEIVTDGEEAVQFLNDCFENKKEELVPQLIFVDLDMPFMDGFQFLDTFNKMDFQHKSDERMVTAVLTSSVSKQDMERAKDFSVDAYIVKPLTKEKMMELMEDHFGWQTKNHV